MFLKRFKEKSNQKYINNLLDVNKRQVHDKKIGTVGVIINFQDYNNYDKLRLLFKNIGLNDNRIKFIAFLDDQKEMPNSWDSFFNSKDFGWKGKINNLELNEFIDTKFDALISYYKKDTLELDLVSALSKANFKIGLSNKEPRLFDLIIDIEPKHIDIFQSEVVKYLKVLNKI